MILETYNYISFTHDESEQKIGLLVEKNIFRKRPYFEIKENSILITDSKRIIETINMSSQLIDLIKSMNGLYLIPLDSENAIELIPT